MAPERGTPMQRVIDQVRGILARAGYAFDIHAEGREFRVPSESTLLYIAFSERDGEVFVHLRAPLLQEVDEAVPGREALLGHVNRLNCELLFGRVCWYADRHVVSLEHSLIANTLDAEEFRGTLDRLVATADSEDEQLKTALGTGVTAREQAEARSAQNDAVDT